MIAILKPEIKKLLSHTITIVYSPIGIGTVLKEHLLRECYSNTYSIAEMMF